MFSGDDDFLSTDGVEESIKFLENNQNYAASHGKILHVVFKLPGHFCIILFYSQRTFNAWIIAELLDFFQVVRRELAKFGGKI